MKEGECEQIISFNWIIRGRSARDVQRQLELITRMLRELGIEYSLNAELGDNAKKALK